MEWLTFKEFLCIIYARIIQFFTGAITVLTGSYFLYHLLHYNSFTPPHSSAPFVCFILTGLCQFFISWCGVSGASRWHDFHIILYIISTFLMALINLALAIGCLALRSKTWKYISENMEKSLREMIAQNQVKKSWLRLQVEFECCGIRNGENYPFAKTCVTYNRVGVLPGCHDKLSTYIYNIFLDGAILGFLATAFQIFGLIVFIVFLRSMRNDRKKRLSTMTPEQIRNASQLADSRPPTTTTTTTAPA